MNKNILLVIIALMASFLLGCNQQDNPKTLLILHTNDVHSAVEPNAKAEGGFALRKAMIDSLNLLYSNVLLLDAGDYFQGTPYFNFYGGKIEIEAMNKMGYDAITLGNHEFDNGVDALVDQIKLFQGKVLSANYDVSESALKSYVVPYTIFDKQGIKIGVFGLGVSPDGLIKADLFEGVRYLNPIEEANKTAKKLKHHYKCDIVVCISHLGYRYANQPEKVCDSIIAIQSKNIDIILGGHTHDLIVNKKLTNLSGKEVTIAQMGRNGLYLGKVVVEIK